MAHEEVLHSSLAVSPTHAVTGMGGAYRSEEHTSELQSRENLVCRLLLEKKKEVPTSTPRATARLRIPRPASCGRSATGLRSRWCAGRSSEGCRRWALAGAWSS